MQYSTLLSALLVGLSVSGVAAEAKHGFRGAHGRAPKIAQQPTAVESSTAAATAATASAAATGTSSSGSSGSSDVLELNPSNVQTGSESNGIIASASEAGQAASATDPANFINFCTGKTLTNGLQNIAGSCNGIVMGDIPAKTNMVSTVITFPQNGQTIAANQTFNFSSTTTNMVFGSFTNAKTTYYAAPQALDKATGNIIGHLHFTVQAMTAQNVLTPLDPTVFAFFKGVNDAGDGKGDLQATVLGGLAPGNYRVCTMTSASNHQPVIMPVAQRGPQDDCIRFTVAPNGASGSTGTGSASSSVVASSAAATATAGTASTVAASSAASATATEVASTGTAAPPKNAGGSSCDTGKKGKKGGRRGRKGARSVEFEA